MNKLCKICKVDLGKPKELTRKWYCVECLAIKKRQRAKPKKMSASKLLEYQLRRYYKVSLQFYLELLTKQNGVCAICNQPELRKSKSRLSVDHCHKTGKIRGLLCDGCNNMLGRSNDSISKLLSAVAYLKRTQE